MFLRVSKVVIAWLKRTPLAPDATIWVKGALNIGWLFTSTGTMPLAYRKEMGTSPQSFCTSIYVVCGKSSVAFMSYFWATRRDQKFGSRNK